MFPYRRTSAREIGLITNQILRQTGTNPPVIFCTETSMMPHVDSHDLSQAAPALIHVAHGYKHIVQRGFQNTEHCRLLCQRFWNSHHQRSPIFRVAGHAKGIEHRDHEDKRSAFHCIHTVDLLRSFSC